jgi:hypothetical protein
MFGMGSIGGVWSKSKKVKLYEHQQASCSTLWVVFQLWMFSVDNACNILPSVTGSKTMAMDPMWVMPMKRARSPDEPPGG